ncbi:SRPBCC family protein [Myxococcota bacterium]|nr:SRPBCC family protein [Myxococcota bacterium]
MSFTTLVTALFLMAPTVTIDSAGAVIGRMTLNAPITKVRSIVGDAEKVGKLVPQVRSVTSRPAGACVVLEVVSAGLIGDVVYKSRRCPTASGWAEHLTSSDDLKQMSAVWSLTERGAQTDVHFSLTVDVGAYAPTILVQSLTKDQVTTTLQNLEAQVNALP